jgi:threonine dehydratase
MSPLEIAPARLAGERRLYLKREDTHELGAFKWRGALPVLEEYRAAGARAVVTASTGNHGAATAWAAAQLGLEAIVFVPEDASATKLARIEELGADIRRAGRDLDESKERGQAEAAERGLPFFEDGAEPAQYDGYRAIGDELLDQLGVPRYGAGKAGTYAPDRLPQAYAGEPPAAVVVPVGNGALLGGVGRAILARSPETLRVGVVAAEAPVMADSYEARRPIAGERCATFADGLAVRVAIPYAVALLDEVATHMLRVSERELAHAVAAFAETGIRVEGAAAAALAALPQLHAELHGPIVLVVTGCNIDDKLLEQAKSRPDSFPG